MFATIAALTGVLTAEIIYGTDVFCALVQRPALARLDDATMAAVMGRVHEYGDRRLRVAGLRDRSGHCPDRDAHLAGPPRSTGRSPPQPPRT